MLLNRSRFLLRRCIGLGCLLGVTLWGLGCSERGQVSAQPRLHQPIRTQSSSAPPANNDLPSSSAPPPSAPPAEGSATTAAPSTDGSATTTVPHPPAASPPTSHADAGTLIRLPVKGFDDAWVAIPKSGTGPRPIAVAAHANWDRAIWECRWWRRLLPDMFLLCPFGILRSDSPSPDDPRYTFADDKALEAEVDAGLAALRARFGVRLNSTAPMLWVGLSRGAYLGAKIAARRPAHFPRMILAEGGHDPWTGPNAQAYAQGGVRRILFVCGQGACTVLAKKAARTLQHFGVETKRIDVPGMGHGLSDDADKSIIATLPWLLSRSP